MMETAGDVVLSLEAVRQLAFTALVRAGCDQENADAVAETIMMAERDGAHAHGLFRLPGYVASLKSGKVDGRARPSCERIAPSANMSAAGYAPSHTASSAACAAACAVVSGWFSPSCPKASSTAAFISVTTSSASRRSIAIAPAKRSACTILASGAAPASRRSSRAAISVS